MDGAAPRDRWIGRLAAAVATVVLAAIATACLPVAVPTAPTSVSASPGNGAAKVSWSLPYNGGTPVTGYIVTPYIGATAQTPVTFTSTATTQTVSGLTTGTAYTFTVAATNAVGTGPASAASNVIVVGTPTAPGSPRAMPGDRSATVSWTAATPNGSPVNAAIITPYANGVAQAPRSYPWARTTETLPGLVNGVTYTFTVAIGNGIGYGPALTTPPIVVGAPTAPEPAGASPGDAAATVSWTPAIANAAPITGYVVTPFIGTTALPDVTVPPPGTTHLFTGLTNGVSYTFRVAATNAVGTGPRAATAPIVVGTPAAPGSAAAVPGNTTATVSWTTPAANASPLTGYVFTMYSKDCADGFCHPYPPVTQTLAPTVTSLTVPGLVNNYTRYRFTIAAVNAVGTGPEASTGDVRIGTASAPGTPTAMPGNGSARVSWSASSGDGSDVLGYKITTLAAGVPAVPANFTSDLSFVVNGLTNGTAYTFAVSVLIYNGDGPTSVTPPITVGTPTSPAAPVAAGGNSRATVSWTAPADNGSPLTGYVITPVRNGTAQAPRPFASTATSQILTGLTNGATYTFAVAAINAVGAGPASSTPPIIVGLPGAPGTPTAVAGDTTATVTWTAPIANGSVITGYVVTPNAGGVDLAPQTFASAALTETVTGLTNGTAYSFRVAAINAAGTGPASAASNAVTPAGPPAAPGFLTAQGGDAQVSFSWWPPDSNGSPLTGSVITPFINGIAQTPRIFTTPVNHQTVTGLTNGTTYTFAVAITNALGTGPATTTGPVPVGVPTAPGTPSAEPGNATATVTWTAASGNGSPVTAYVITPYVGATAKPAQTFDSVATTQTVSGLTNGVTYTFRVAAINAIGTGPTATTIATTVGAPTSPGTPTAASGNFHAVISWTAPGDNGSPITSYRVTPYLGSVAQPAQTFAATATTQTIGELTNGRSYSFRITAINARGAGATSSTAPVVIGRPAIAVVGGLDHSCALLDDGTVGCWGANGSGQLGDGTTTDRPRPASVAGLTGVTAISSTTGPHTCALLVDRTVRCWGGNHDGQLGDGTTVDRTTPVAVVGLTGVRSIAAGASQTCAVLDDGTARCWGAGAYGQLGNRSSDGSLTPVVVQGLTNATAIAANQWYTCAVLADATVRCWGTNMWHQLGVGDWPAQSYEPLSPVGLTGVASLSLGLTGACAMLTDLTVRCWGANDGGELGLGQPGYFPHVLLELPDARTAAPGNYWMCAGLADGTARCMGMNYRGLLGDGTTINRRFTPVVVQGLTGVTTLSTGNWHTCALINTGAVRCWGANDAGQLGDGTTTDRTTPVTAMGP